MRSIATIAVLALCTAASLAQAANLPRQISIIVPYPPGSTSDLLPRLVGPYLSQALGVTVVVENAPGANGAIGAQRVARAPADGSQILMAPTGVLAANQFIYPKLSYDPEKSFEPIMNAASTPNMIVVGKNVPANNLPELIKLIQDKPGALTFASAGPGSTSHLCGEMLKSAAKADIVHVPFRGPAPAKQAVLSGDVSIICDNLSNVINDAKEGTLKAIALTAPERNPQAPDVPTSAEQGYPAIEAGIWYSFVAPAGTPRELIETLNVEIAKILKRPDVESRLSNLALTVVADRPAEFAAFLKVDTAHWKQVIEAAGIKLE
jgi:tripartite-type tricarboxylate transporter receptor subunit TctC